MVNSPARRLGRRDITLLFESLKLTTSPTSSPTTTAQANSGLGLVYFRQEDWKNSVSQMQKATDGDPNPDPVDLYILGMGLSKLNRYGEAADSFQKCSQMPGGMQDRCKQKAAEAKTQTTSQPVPPK